jgi:protein phosphatase 1 regulatory subunit 7
LPHEKNIACGKNISKNNNEKQATHIMPLELKDLEIASNSEHEDTDAEEQGDQNGQLPPTTLQGQVIPDEHPEQIDADEDLAAEFPDDTEYLELVHLKIRSMEDLNLGRFKQLKSLVLRQNLLDSMGEVKHVPDEIEELDLYDNRIKHISSHVNDKTGLKNLDLSFNKIRNIKNIDKLVHLENLYFVQNKITDIVNLDTFSVLKNLELGGNRILKIENLNNLQNLTELWLGKNRISKLENLSSLKSLKILSIQSNRITKLEGLEGLENLEELYISHNGIEKIEGLDKNLKLTTLDITGNRITMLENLSHLKNLTDLWASYNKFESFDDAEKQLKDLAELDTVYFEGNPLQLQNMTSYRRKLIMFLPQVNKIDATYVR